MASQKNEYMVVVNDKPGSLEKRLEVRKYVLSFLSLLVYMFRRRSVGFILSTTGYDHCYF